MGAVLGVDVSLGRGLDVVLMRDSTVEVSWSRIGPDGLRALLADLRPAAVGIDAPPQPGLGLLREESERLRLTVPPQEGKHVARRVAEYELSRRGIGSHQTHYDDTRLFSWMTAGFETFRAASEAGYQAYVGGGRRRGVALEAFAYASYVTLAGCLSPGRRWRLRWREAVLRRAGVAGLPDGASIDLLDAACSALTAERFVLGETCYVGDPREGLIVLPVPRLEERYRRCAPPDGDIRPAAASPAPRLCECGCGEPVRRRFLPGHDAKLKSRLLLQARAGERARRELMRLGWKER